MISTTLIFLLFFAFINAENSKEIPENTSTSELLANGGHISPEQPHGLGRAHFKNECSTLSSHSMLEFASQLNDANLKVFCGEFNDMQREKAMQIADDVNYEGNSMMTPDQAVEKVVKESK